VGIVCACLAQAQATKEREDLAATMIPLARDFIARNALRFDTNFGTNSIACSNVYFGPLRRGADSRLLQARLCLTNGWVFHCASDGTNSEIDFFDTATKTFYDSQKATTAEIREAKELNRRNKLTEKRALKLAKRHFKALGHREKDFHPPEFGQMNWGEPGNPDCYPSPFYEFLWFRKDVSLADVDKGMAPPSILIIVSGITTNIIHYDKFLMPVGRDF
jgi:hypothetical protein